MKAMWESIRLWWQAIVQDRSESVPFPLTREEWAIIQQHETARQVAADAKALSQ